MGIVFFRRNLRASEFRIFAMFSNTSCFNSVDSFSMKVKISGFRITNSGKVIVIKDDKATQELLQYEAEMSGKKIGMAKITLTGSISEDREINSDKREVTYTFTLELNMNGTSRWIGQEQISKQSDRSSFGF